MTPENFLKAELAALCWREAGHIGGLDVLLAVGCVMRNRVRAGWFGGDWLQVLYGADEVRGNVGSAIGPRSPVAGNALDLKNPVARQLLNVIDDVFSGLMEDRWTLDHANGGAALYYCEPHRSLRPWFKDKILARPEEHPRVANVSSMVFFK